MRRIESKSAVNEYRGMLRSARLNLQTMEAVLRGVYTCGKPMYMKSDEESPTGKFYYGFSGMRKASDGSMIYPEEYIRRYISSCYEHRIARDSLDLHRTETFSKLTNGVVKMFVEEMETDSNILTLAPCNISHLYSDSRDAPLELANIYKLVDMLADGRVMLFIPLEVYEEVIGI